MIDEAYCFNSLTSSTHTNDESRYSAYFLAYLFVTSILLIIEFLTSFTDGISEVFTIPETKTLRSFLYLLYATLTTS